MALQSSAYLRLISVFLQVSSVVYLSFQLVILYLLISLHNCIFCFFGGTGEILRACYIFSVRAVLIIIERPCVENVRLLTRYFYQVWYVAELCSYMRDILTLFFGRKT